MSQKCLTSWKSPFVVGGVIGTVLLLVGMNLMVGAHVSSSDETQTASPTQIPKTSGSSTSKSRHFSVDGPVLVGLGFFSILVGSTIGCVKYFRMHKQEKIKARRQNGNTENDPAGSDGADNDAYSTTPKSQMSAENTPPSTPLADMVGIMKNPSPKHDSVIITSEINPMTIIKNQSPSSRHLRSGSPSSPMPLLSPLETHFVFQSLTNTNQDKSSSASSSPVSVRGNNRSSWYISESPDSYLVRADYNELQCDSSPNMSFYQRSSSTRSSRGSTSDMQRNDDDQKSDSLNPNLLHPGQVYYHESIKKERPVSPLVTGSDPPYYTTDVHRWHPQTLGKDISDQSSAHDTSNTTVSEEDAGISRLQHSDDSGYGSNKKQSRKGNADKSSDTPEYAFTSDELPRRSLTKSRNASSSSSASSERGSKTKRVTIAVSSGEDTVFEDVITIFRPQNPVPPKSPRPRTYSTGAKYSSPRSSGRRHRQLSYPGSHRETPEEDNMKDDQDIPKSNIDDRYSEIPPSKKGILRDRNYRDSGGRAKRTTVAYGQDYDWSHERANKPQKMFRHSYQADPENEPAGVHRNGSLFRKVKSNPSEIEENENLHVSKMSQRQTRPYSSNSVDYQETRRDIEGAESPRMRHHSETLERPKTWADGLHQKEDMSLGNKRLSDLPEVYFPHTQNNRRRRRLPDLELVKRRQSRGSSSSATSATTSPGVDVANEDTDDDNEWI